VNKLNFSFVDVFAEKKYAGNQLAVIRGAGALSAEEMQAIAREINFSESTFILADEPRDGGYDVRIFTPKHEVPFAGHPTLGTAHIIRSVLLGGKAEQVVLNLQVGPIPVTFSPDGYCWMKQIEPVFGPQHPLETLAGVLGLDPGEIDLRFPVEEVSTGLQFFIVPLKTLASLQKARIDRPKYDKLVNDTEAKGILIFCPESHGEQHSDLSVRVFVDYFGVPEDPATGSGNGCLAGYLAGHRYFGQAAINVRAEQGYEIGRPSLLLLKTEQRDGKIEVYVGGKSVTVAEGQLL
jgi:trans-2,3-dihydro-3-hydroxyanthranilate isomerase